MCAIDDAEPWQFYRRTEVRGRKTHHCSECGRTINVRERHHYTVGKVDGDMSSWRTCAQCFTAASWLVETCDGWILGALADDLWEHWREAREHRSVWLARALVGMRRQWKKRDGSLMEPLPEYVSAA